jgi:hypothetical protein
VGERGKRDKTYVGLPLALSRQTTQLGTYHLRPMYILPRAYFQAGALRAEIGDRHKVIQRLQLSVWPFNHYSLSP